VGGGGLMTRCVMCGAQTESWVCMPCHRLIWSRIVQREIDEAVSPQLREGDK
jgi:hypothetical protein